MNHYIIVKFKPNVNNRETLYQEIAALFARSTGIEGIHQVTIHTSCIDKPNHHDLMIHMQMDPQALPVLDHSEIHRMWKERYGRYVEEKTVFDCNE